MFAVSIPQKIVSTCTVDAVKNVDVHLEPHHMMSCPFAGGIKMS